MRERIEIVVAAGFAVEISGDRSKPLTILTRMAASETQSGIISRVDSRSLTSTFGCRARMGWTTGAVC